MIKIKGCILMLIISLSLFGFTSCQQENNNQESTTALITYEQITPEEAKKIMDTQKAYIIIDARTEVEFAEGHIEGAILIPEYEITQKGIYLIDTEELIRIIN